MTASTQRSDRSPRAGEAGVVVTGPDAGGTRRARLSRLPPGWMPVLPALVTLAVTLWGIGSASFWRDEAATVTAVRRSLPEMIRMLGHVDAVHGAYYLLMWPLAQVFGTTEFIMRLPSAIAMAAAAFGIAVTGRRLGSLQTGVLAGLVFAALPMTSRFGQEARSYAVVTAIAVLASYLLVRAIDEPRRRWAVGYGLTLVALGFLNMFGLLIVPAHAMWLAAARKHGSRGGGELDSDQAAVTAAGSSPGTARGRANGTARGRATGTARGCAIAATLALVAIVPVALLAWHERHQLAWLRRPTVADALALLTTLTGSGASFVLISALGLAGAACNDGGRLRGAVHPERSRSHRRSTGQGLLWLSATWLFLPPAALILVSEIKPVYMCRYVMFCLPAIALLAGAGLAVLGRFWRIAAVTMLALLALPMQQAIRRPSGHGDNIRAAAQLLRVQARPGDAVVYLRPGFRDLGAVYPYGFTWLRDIGLRESAVAAGNLSGTEVPRRVLERRLRRFRRVWLVEVSRNQPDPGVISAPRFRLVRVWPISDIALRLYEQGGKQGLYEQGGKQARRPWRKPGA